jgi:hypothetical protein
MKKLSLGLSAIVICYLFTINAIAQSDKLSLLIAPKPNQTSRQTTTQEIVMDISFDGEVPEQLAAMKAMKIEVKSVVGMVLKTGPLDKDGRLEAEISFDQADTEMTMGGNPLPGGGMTKNIIGKKIKIILDSKGTLVDLSTPDDLAASRDMIKQMLQSLYGNLPKEPIGIGETAILPFNLDYPLPLPGAPPMKFDGQVKTKLLALEPDADGRIAKFEQTIYAKILNNINLDSPSGKFAMNLDLKLNGGGISQFNVDKGLEKASEMNLNLDGRIGIKIDPQLPDMLFKGTIKISVIGKE